jgi:hypothetical protein
MQYAPADHFNVGRTIVRGVDSNPVAPRFRYYALQGPLHAEARQLA